MHACRVWALTPRHAVTGLMSGSAGPSPRSRQPYFSCQPQQQWSPLTLSSVLSGGEFGGSSMGAHHSNDLATASFEAALEGTGVRQKPLLGPSFRPLPSHSELRTAALTERSYRMQCASEPVSCVRGEPRNLGEEVPPTDAAEVGAIEVGDSCIEPSGESIVWPWEQSERPKPTQAGRPAKRFKSDEASQSAWTSLMRCAMMASTADGGMGENSTGVRAWKAFCRAKDVDPIRMIDPNAPIMDKLEDEQLAMEFVCALVESRGVQVDTASNYFSQVQGWMGRKCGVKLCGGLKLSRLPAMLKGLRRIIGENPAKVRRGVAAQSLRRAMDIMLDPSNPRDANIRAALASAFQGLMRSYEYCDTGKGPRGTKAVLSRIPSRKDLKVLTAERLVFMMCPCKNMKHLSGKTVPLVIGGGGTYIDAVAEMRNLMRVDPTPTGLDPGSVPLFRDPATNAPIQADALRRLIKNLMAAVGEDPSQFGTHSLRIGGATALFAQGATPMVIRTMGRWSSDCYRLYVRACYQSSLSWTAAAGSAVVDDIEGPFAHEYSDCDLE